MPLTRQQKEDLQFIMGAEEEMIPRLRFIKTAGRLLNPWGKKFPSVFRSLKLKPGMRVLDIPCGQGGVSVPLAKHYKVRVTGYDIMPPFIRYANEYARQKGVAHLCSYRVKDIRDSAQQKQLFDVVLYVGAPHVWGGAKATIRQLRKRVRSQGLIMIADAYLDRGVRKGKILKDYDNFKNTTRGYRSYGDKIIRVYDYKHSLWRHDYVFTHREVSKAVRRAVNKQDKEVLKRFRDSLHAQQQESTKMGLAFWIIRKKK